MLKMGMAVWLACGVLLTTLDGGLARVPLLPGQLDRLQCPPLSEDGNGLFGKPPVLKVRVEKSEVCRQMALCEVSTTPPENTVDWYVNNELVHSEGQDDVTQRATDREVLGVTNIAFRLCLDSFLKPGDNTFKCNVRSRCQPQNSLKSKLFKVQSSAEPSAVVPSGFPVISMLTTMRMEFADRIVQLTCHAHGAPKPRIYWSYLDETTDDDGLYYPLDAVRGFVQQLDENNVLIDTARTDLASISLKCTASNQHGQVSEHATLVILNEE